jgi:hypothetical protein
MLAAWMAPEVYGCSDKSLKTPLGPDLLLRDDFPSIDRLLHTLAAYIRQQEIQKRGYRLVTCAGTTKQVPQA